MRNAGSANKALSDGPVPIADHSRKAPHEIVPTPRGQTASMCAPNLNPHSLLAKARSGSERATEPWVS